MLASVQEAATDSPSSKHPSVSEDKACRRRLAGRGYHTSSGDALPAVTGLPCPQVWREHQGICQKDHKRDREKNIEENTRPTSLCLTCGIDGYLWMHFKH